MVLYYQFSACVLVIVQCSSVTDSAYIRLAFPGVKSSPGHDSQCYEWIIMFLVQCFDSGGVVFQRTVTACRELIFTLAVKCRGLYLIQGSRQKEWLGSHWILKWNIKEPNYFLHDKDVLKCFGSLSFSHQLQSLVCAVMKGCFSRWCKLYKLLGRFLFVFSINLCEFDGITLMILIVLYHIK